MRNRRDIVTGALSLGLSSLVGERLARAQAKPTPPPEKEITLAVIVHRENPEQKLSLVKLDAIFRVSLRHWSNGQNIIPLNYPIGDRLRTAFDAVALRFTAEDAAEFWLDQRIRAGVRAPRHISDSRTVRRLVAVMAGAIGYIPKQELDGSVRVVAYVEKGRVMTPEQAPT